MIKVRRMFNHITKEYFLSNKVICKTNRATKWYYINKYTTTTQYWDHPLDPTLGPTCLSAWSK